MATDAETGEYLKTLPPKHLEPLWSQMSLLVPALPKPVAEPHMWEYSEVFPSLAKAGEIVPEDKAERRVLMLVNPSMKAPCTTDTIYAGLQLVNPGETAPAHRHVASAFRFIIDGEGFTAVEGQKLPLRRGDVVVTPAWRWHDHGNESERPVVWLDVLDLPLFTYARVNFAEGYGEKRYPSQPVEASEWRHPWSDTQKALDAQTGDHAVYHYRDVAGEPLARTLGAQAERIGPGTATTATQDIRSFVYHCYAGQGFSMVEAASGGETLRLEWTSRDTFAVPAWSKVVHVNSSETEQAYLVGMHDGPFLDALGLRQSKT
ncbi:Gentisate 1,2-dioxygenase [Purpureocillium takamizusanense]|uniref:Gentisate 1,2-dioxygenase n=1 Tax=Purpureocillium takamizusanense TaxID=2060973 RepID=A0A9Q8QJB3_9HYPO|nr:Gentisate 1,2-dioxygenase [Purpureocillium takamizusanense]UNI19642.1 Gentisate 1,2-dioxygenase [Purpureocillium takamizusanense]